MFGIPVALWKSSKFCIIFTATWDLCRNGTENRHSLRFNSWKYLELENEMFSQLLVFFEYQANSQLYLNFRLQIGHRVPNLHLIQLVPDEFLN